MSEVIFLPEHDYIGEKKVLDKFFDTDSAIILTTEQVYMFFQPGIIPEGKQRKAGTLELEDIPPPSTEQLEVQAKATRDSAIANFVGEVIFDGASFQASQRSKLDMDRAIRKAALLSHPDTDSRPWRLTDNTWRETTFAEMKEIVNLVELEVLQNWESVWAQFYFWDAGAKDSPFVLGE